MARQRRNETATEFLEQCMILARRNTPCVTDPVMQRTYNKQAERMLLAGNTAGLIGTPNRQARFTTSSTADEALGIAVTVAQDEIQGSRNNTFHADAETVIICKCGATAKLHYFQMCAACPTELFASV
jgi:hypothetical protein